MEICCNARPDTELAAAMIGYFDDLSEAIRCGDVEESQLADIARRHAMEVVGPVPETYL